MPRDLATELLDVDPAATRFYQTAMRRLQEAGIPFLVGGSHALVRRTRMPRRSKDLDLFVLPDHVDRVLATLAAEGYRTEFPYTHWLAKVYCGEDFIDVIFNSGNGLCPVDERWFEHAMDAVVLDIPVKLCPLEETIWQKAFIMERHRYDGADVSHLLRVGAPGLDWQRLLERFGDHWQVLFSHLVLFAYVYPADAAYVPRWLREELCARYLQLNGSSSNGCCRGTLLSSVQYRDDLVQEGWQDARLKPHGSLSVTQLSQWMASFDE